MQIIEIVVSPAGQARVETKGFTGPACRDASRFLEQALGRRTAETLTSGFHQTTSQPQQLTEGT